jgi:hypothetical protein
MDVRMAVVKKRTEILYQLSCEYQTEYSKAKANHNGIMKTGADTFMWIGVFAVGYALFYWSFHPILIYFIVSYILLVCASLLTIEIGTHLTVNHGPNEVGAFRNTLQEMNETNVDRYEAELRVLEEFFGHKNGSSNE